MNSLTHEGESACYLAATRGHLAVVRLLLKAHANINQLTNDLSCPLYAGIKLAHDQTGVNVFSVTFPFVWIVKFDLIGLCLSAISAVKCFPTAVDGGYKEVVELLVSKGAEVNRTHTASCWTCLHQAVYKVITDLTSTHTTLLVVS